MKKAEFNKLLCSSIRSIVKILGSALKGKSKYFVFCDKVKNCLDHTLNAGTDDKIWF